MTVAKESSAARRWALLRLFRPTEWVKNAFVLAPLIFSRQFTDLNKVAESVSAFGLFCLAASAVYILNDLHDIERDRRHPTKRLSRPIAAGHVSKRQAQVVLGVVMLAMLFAFTIRVDLMVVVAAYFLMNVAYTFLLKSQAVVDIFVIAIGFVLRVYAGAVALNVPLSGWMMITTLCLALYLAALKRRQELSVNGVDSREVLKHYSVALMDRYAEMAGTGALVFYSLYVMSANQSLKITIPLVIFGLFRYWYVVERQEGGESPSDALFGDWQLLAVVAGWAALCVGILLWQ